MAIIERNKNINRKFQIALVFSSISICIVFLTNIIAINQNVGWLGLGLGFILMLAAILVHWIGKNYHKLYGISFLFNNIGIGFSIATYYTVREIPFNAKAAGLALIAAIIILIISSAVIKYNLDQQKGLFKVVIVVIVLILVALIILWLMDENNIFYSASFFLLVNLLFHLILFNSLEEQTDVYKQMSGYSFGLYFVITIIVLAILSEGDLVDGIDLLPGRKQKKK